MAQKSVSSLLQFLVIKTLWIMFTGLVGSVSPQLPLVHSVKVNFDMKVGLTLITVLYSLLASEALALKLCSLLPANKV